MAAQLAQEIRQFIMTTLRDHEAESLEFDRTSRSFSILTLSGCKMVMLIPDDVSLERCETAVELANNALSRDMFEIRIEIV